MTRRLEAPLVEWTADDVLALLKGGIDEGQRLEYKRELKLDDRKQSREAAKDASGLANAQGGLLIYGVDEEELKDGRRRPTAPRPLTDGAVQARLEDVLDSAVTPRLNMESRLLPTEGGYFLVVRLHQHGGMPHMVDSYNENRYYVRVGLKTRPMAHHELEAVFGRASGDDDRAHRRLAGLPLVPRLEGVEVKNRTSNMEPWPWLSVVTLPLDAPDPLLEMRSPCPHDFADDDEYKRWGHEQVLWRTYSWDALGYRDEFEELDTVARKDDPESEETVLAHRVRLYRNGVFEWGGGCVNAGDKAVATLWVAEKVHDVLGYFATTYKQAGYYGRVRIWVSLDGARDSTLMLPLNYVRRSNPKLTIPHVEWRSDENVERLLHNLDAITHAAMDRIWVAYGFERSLDFNEDGTFRSAS
jgi:hypothetical protein